jgi:hypothetical protein
MVQSEPFIDDSDGTFLEGAPVPLRRARTRVLYEIRFREDLKPDFGVSRIRSKRGKFWNKVHGRAEGCQSECINLAADWTIRGVAMAETARDAAHTLSSRRHKKVMLRCTA